MSKGDFWCIIGAEVGRNVDLSPVPRFARDGTLPSAGESYKEESMRETNIQKMIELLALVLHCPICAAKYNAENTNVIRSESLDRTDESSMLVHTDCERCKSSVVFSISMDGPEIFSVGMVTDLTSADAARFRDADQISVDEVMGFHDFLETFDGNFERVLR